MAPGDEALCLTVASIVASNRVPDSTLLNKKIRVAGRVHAYDAPQEVLTIQDGDTADTVRVDVSLCVSPFRTYPWLEERNTVVLVMGYVEAEHEDEGGDVIVKAILLEDRSELDLRLWSKAVSVGLGRGRSWPSAEHRG